MSDLKPSQGCRPPAACLRASVTAVAAVLVLVVPAPSAQAADPSAAPVAGPRAPADIDPAGIVFFPDEGRLEIKGTRLDGLRIGWTAPGPPPTSGDDVCRDPKPLGSGSAQQCVFAVPKNLPLSSLFRILPEAMSAETSATGAAKTAPPPPLPAPTLKPARIVVDRLLPATATIDLAAGVGRLALVHPEAVASADCAPARCELLDTGVEVRGVAASATNVTLRLRLAPHISIRKGETLDTTQSATLAVLHCTAAIVSGEPLRHADGTRVIVRLDERCGGDARNLRWTVNGESVEVQRVEHVRDGIYVQLGTSELESAQATVVATRSEPDGSVIAVARSATRPLPQPRVTLDLEGFGRIDFIPTNRDALVRPSPCGEHAHLVPLPIESAYQVTTVKGVTHIRGEPQGSGFVALRFGYRVDTLPDVFASTDLAVVDEPLQRPLREASVPAPFGAAALSQTPLIDLICTDRQGRPQHIAPGVQASIPFSQRDSCHLMIHRERLRVEDGTQDISIEVNVTKVDDNPRSGAQLVERMVLRPGAEPRVFWIRGVKAQFDRLAVRVSHIIDEAHDVGGSDLHINVPSVQWAVVVGEGHFRFYATAAIPTGLFRMTEPTDVLTLNFGVLSRLTWLDREGHEGLLGLEFGAMGIGLAATPGFPRTLAVLAGLGVGVPIGNRGEPSQASVNLHAWAAYELRHDFPLDPTNPTGPQASHWSFLFGPSITFGNVGTNL
jgi:hypothetical protein